MSAKPYLKTISPRKGPQFRPSYLKISGFSILENAFYFKYYLVKFSSWKIPCFFQRFCFFLKLDLSIHDNQIKIYHELFWSVFSVVFSRFCTFSIWKPSSCLSQDSQVEIILNKFLWSYLCFQLIFENFFYKCWIYFVKEKSNFFKGTCKYPSFFVFDSTVISIDPIVLLFFIRNTLHFRNSKSKPSLSISLCN